MIGEPIISGCSTVIYRLERGVKITCEIHVPGRKAVVFCASIKHAREVAGLFRNAGVAARAVDGGMKKSEREGVLEAYRINEIQVLCACDMLNEGWDSPETSVLFMARPTLSKVIYLQQIGRGTRKAHGKDALLVFDFIDNTNQYNHAVNLHRLLKQKNYIPGGLVIAPSSQIAEEKDRFLLGEKPDVMLPHNIFATDYEIVDLFDWQDEIKDMVSMHQLALELYVDDKTVRNWINSGKISPGPDLELPMGNITHRYFRKERIDQMRQELGIKKRTADSLRENFIDFVRKGDLSMSYKPVMLKTMLSLADEKGELDLSELTEYFGQFYEKRVEAGLPVERENSKMNQIKFMSDFEICRLMLGNPFEKFERKFFMEHRKELNKVAFAPALWKQLSSDDRTMLLELCDEQIAAYYEKRVK